MEGRAGVGGRAMSRCARALDLSMTSFTIWIVEGTGDMDLGRD